VARHDALGRGAVVHAPAVHPRCDRLVRRAALLRRPRRAAARLPDARGDAVRRRDPLPRSVGLRDRTARRDRTSRARQAARTDLAADRSSSSAPATAPS
jgi:hypothetical protein